MLIDTSGLVNVHNRSEPFHESSRQLYHGSTRRLTHSYILAEYLVVTQARRLPRAAALSFLNDLLDNATMKTVWVDEPLHREAVRLLMKRKDKTYSLCDAVSFVLMKDHGINETLTNDKHFEQEGFQRLLV